MRSGFSCSNSGQSRVLPAAPSRKDGLLCPYLPQALPVAGLQAAGRRPAAVAAASQVEEEASPGAVPREAGEKEQLPAVALVYKRRFMNLERSWHPPF